MAYLPRRRRSFLRSGWIWFMVALVAIIAAGIPGRFTNDKNAKHLLVNQGFSNIHQVDRHVYFVEFRGCGDSDVALFVFKATNSIGKVVRVEVCQGWPFKGSTIRG